MEEVRGYIEKILFRNEENGYTVMSVNEKNTEIPCVGIFHYINEGEYIEVRGEYTVHPSYGQQLSVKEYEIIAPEDEESIIRYLGSGAIKGIKISTATKIVNKFGKDTFKIIEEQPERLAEIKGISEKKAREISEQMDEKRDMRKAMIFLQQYGLSMTLAVKLYNYYGPGISELIKKNPYKIADDIDGVGFRIADEIASKVGISSDSDFRIQSGLLYALSNATLNGHVYLPKQELMSKTMELLGLSDVDFERHITEMSLDKRIIVRDENVYSMKLYYTELGIARKLTDLNVAGEIDEKQVIEKLSYIEDKEGIALDEKQEMAVLEAVRSGLVIITGGPGTGKTTTINAIIKFFESENMEIMLAAPTGRAAKRMQEATGYDAQTIHRLLEVNGNPDENTADRFERNEMNPLEADVIIIDEMSMVDVFLMHSLLKAVMVGTRLILVGDVNQLPSVGPGNVLRDIISSEAFNVVRLSKIFRQAQTSDIIVNAHKINNGEKVELAKKSMDFLFIRREEAEQIMSAMVTLIKEKLPGYVNSGENEIQVLTPTRKGLLGVEKLNEFLQRSLNPASRKKVEKEIGGILFREGDKVMQIKNDYQLQWEIRGKYGITVERGMGVFNGDTGIVKKINTYTEYLEVEFDDNKYVTYTFKEATELELAYAVTIHKSQGTEYPAVVMPMFQGPQMLMNRNLLYTAVTRARKCVCLLGRPEVFFSMAENSRENQRYSGLEARIKELEEDVK